MMGRLGLGGPQQRRVGTAGCRHVAAGGELRVPLPSTWNGANVLSPAAVLTPKMSLKRNLPLGEIRFCEGEVPSAT